MPAPSCSWRRPPRLQARQRTACCPRGLGGLATPRATLQDKVAQARAKLGPLLDDAEAALRDIAAGRKEFAKAVAEAGRRVEAARRAATRMAETESGLPDDDGVEEGDRVTRSASSERYGSWIGRFAESDAPSAPEELDGLLDSAAWAEALRPAREAVKDARAALAADPPALAD